VTSPPIIEINNPIRNNPSRFFSGSEMMPRQHLVFERGEERLGRRIVETRPGPAHRLSNIEPVTEGGEIAGGRWWIQLVVATP
jgi:hypothetical protein